MFKYVKAILIVLIFSTMIFTGCSKNKAPDKPSTPAGLTIGSINTQYTFTSSADDPDEDSIAIRFDWGDEDTSNWSASVPSGDSVSMSHTWSDSGTYSIKAQAKDNKDATSVWSDAFSIEIKRNQPPDAPAVPTGPSTGQKDSLYRFTSKTTDPDEDSVCYRFDWGDDDTSNWSSLVASGDSISISHTWSDSGTYSIKAQAKDLYNAVSSWSGGHQIIIGSTMPNNPPNTPTTPVGDSIGAVGTSHTFISTATDPDGDSIAIRFDWGDGARSDWSDWQASGDSISTQYTWSDTGTFNVRAQAKDKKDATSNWSTEHPIKISLSWTKTFGGSNEEKGRSVHQTRDGGYIITGSTKSNGAGGSDVYLVKTDWLGNKQWEKTFGGSADDYGYSVDTTRDGGYIIVGGTNSFGGLCQVYLIKADSSGEQEWYKIKGYNDCDDWGNSVQSISTGGYIIVGRTHDQGSEAILLIKTNSTGENETGWPKIKGYDNDDDEGYSIQQISDGFILVGRTQRFGNGDVFLIKTDANGEGTGSNNFGGSSADYGYSVQQTTGGYIITGWTRSYGAGQSDVYLIKTNTSCGELWTKTFGGISDDVGWSVQPTLDGGYIIAGYTYSYGAGQSDVYLIKTDANGNAMWTRTFGGQYSDYGYSVQQTRDGGYIITGSTGSFGAGTEDVYLIKTDANGNVE